MGQGARGPGFAEKPAVSVVGAAEPFSQELQGDLAVEKRIVGEPHGAHAALTELLDDLIPADSTAYHGAPRVQAVSG